MATCFLCNAKADTKLDAVLEKSVWGETAKVVVPVDICNACKLNESGRSARTQSVLLGVCVVGAIMGGILGGWAGAIVGLAWGGVVTLPIKPLIQKKSRIGEQPKVLELKAQGYKLTYP
jgi:hypothetical protein